VGNSNNDNPADQALSEVNLMIPVDEPGISPLAASYTGREYPESKGKIGGAVGYPPLK